LRKFAICELSTLNASFEDDLAAYSAAGAEGISIFEGKLVAGREAEQLEAFRASGLEASAAVLAANDFEDSLWKLPAEELARLGRARFTQLELSSSSTEGRAA